MDSVKYFNAIFENGDYIYFENLLSFIEHFKRIKAFVERVNFCFIMCLFQKIFLVVCPLGKL